MSIFNSSIIPNSSSSGYEIDSSLRFEDGDSPYLSRTPSGSPTNAKKYTVSVWIKTTARQNNVVSKVIYSTSGGGDNEDYVMFYDDSTTGGESTLRIGWEKDGTSGQGNSRRSYRVFRDPNAWYHFVFAYDSTQSTAADRLKVYCNNELITPWRVDIAEGRDPGLNQDFHWNTAEAAKIGGWRVSTAHWDGYMAEFHNVDGQQLTPSDFGETGDYGEWKPIEYAGTYGNNGFYLPFKHDTTAAGFGVVTYAGTSGTLAVTGAGFQPDFVWIKLRTGVDGHQLGDAIRGVSSSLMSDSTAAESTVAGQYFTSFDADGFTTGTNGAVNNSGSNYVAWCWDMGGSNATNNNGSITSTVRANSAYGQSIVSYTGTGSNATVGHGLSSTPEMIIVKARNSVANWAVLHSGIASDYETDYIPLNNGTQAWDNNAYWNDTKPTSSLFSVGTDNDTNGSSNNYIAYAFHSVAGYSSFGSYSGTGSAGNSVTTGFTPRFLMCKRTDLAEEWIMFDAERNGSPQQFLYANKDNSEGSTDIAKVDFTSTGFTLQGTHELINKSGASYIYMAFADTREALLWADDSGNANNWTANNITASDSVKDSPTNNFPTFDALRPGRPSSWEGNLLTETSTNTISRSVDTNFRASTGKWYAEVYIKVDAYNSGQNATTVGIANETFVLAGNEFKGHNNSVGYEMSGNKMLNTVSSSYGATYATGDIIGIAWDVDNDNITFYKNGASQGQLTSGFSLTNGRVIVATNSSSVTVARYHVNFGQDSSFAGQKTAQSKQDSNSIGDFYYTPPTGFLSLCTKNLPDPAVIPSEHFNTVTYTGNGTSQSITNVGFAPDVTWMKIRSASNVHIMANRLSGNGKWLSPNYTWAETTDSAEFNTFDSDGFSIGNAASTNASGYTYVAWNWKANGTGVSNTSGSINTTKTSANVDAGFSISTYTGTGSNATVGHGLNSAPEMVIVKQRGGSGAWTIYHSGIASDAETDVIEFNTGAAFDSDTRWNDTAPTNSVFSLGTRGEVNGSTNTYIAYCFHSVDGYSKVGSYTGNGSADGTFVYTGFRPAYIMLKESTASGEHWQVYDNKRDEYNASWTTLAPSSSSAETSGSGYDLDMLSNGFKIRYNNNQFNDSSSSYIFIAFAESPFKHTNAR